MARTPNCAPSGSVKRTMRALVVVPMQTFSYLPSAIFRTPGAVWRRNAPRRSIGGSTPWSKMRICVRSRMPMMCPWTTTSSPARSLRISASSVMGNVTSCVAMSGLPVELDGAVGGHVRGRAPRGPALVVDRHRVQGHVRVRVLDVALQDGHVAAQAHRADARFVQQLEELLLELSHDRVGVARAHRAGDRLLRQVHGVVGGAPDADADDAGRARLAAGPDDRLEHELLDPLPTVGG